MNTLFCKELIIKWRKIMEVIIENLKIGIDLLSLKLTKNHAEPVPKII